VLVLPNAASAARATLISSSAFCHGQNATEAICPQVAVHPAMLQLVKLVGKPASEEQHLRTGYSHSCSLITSWFLSHHWAPRELVCGVAWQDLSVSAHERQM